MGNTSTQLRSPCSETWYLKRSLILLLNLPAKTALRLVIRLYFLIAVMFRSWVNILLTNFDPTSVSYKFGDLFEVIREFSNELFMVWKFSIFKGTVHSKLLKLSNTTEIYPYLLKFSGPQSFNSKRQTPSGINVIYIGFVCDVILSWCFRINFIYKSFTWSLCHLWVRIITALYTITFINLTSFIIKFA